MHTLKSATSHYFKNKRIFITGHTGFKGSWLTTWLHSLGAEVIGYALPAVPDLNMFTQLDLAKQITHYEEDVRDLDTLKRVLKKHQPELVIHLAAQALVYAGYEDPPAYNRVHSLDGSP